MGSYNYLGFAQNEGRCADEVELSLRAHGVSYNSPRAEAGTHALHVELEKLTAEFVGTEDAIVCSMGFATNSTIIPALMGKGCLIVSDELNHASIINGCRNSGSTTRVFKHNCAADLERVLRQAIASGQPRTHRPWRKIMIIVEGIYSMEGSVCDLPRIVELKKKYKVRVCLLGRAPLLRDCLRPFRGCAVSRTLLSPPPTTLSLTCATLPSLSAAPVLPLC